MYPRESRTIPENPTKKITIKAHKRKIPGIAMIICIYIYIITINNHNRFMNHNLRWDYIIIPLFCVYYYCFFGLIQLDGF